MPVSWLAILFIVLSLAITSLDDDDPVLHDLARGRDASTNIALLSKRYREAAMKCLSRQGVFWSKHNVQSLQALILLTYAMGHSQEPTWVLLGKHNLIKTYRLALYQDLLDAEMTYNIAVALACHIDPSKFDLDPIQCEERRRCWAGLMMLYTIQNTIIGNPDPSRQISYDVGLPADVEDEDITLAGVHESFTRPTQMSYLLFKFKLYDITAQICSEIFSTSEPYKSAIQKLDNQICLAQESWDSRYIADSVFDAVPTHHAVHLHILHAYSHQLFLLLHRPSLHSRYSDWTCRTNLKFVASHLQKRFLISIESCLRLLISSCTCGTRMALEAFMHFMLPSSWLWRFLCRFTSSSTRNSR